MDFEENRNQSDDINAKKNRKTLILLFVMFMTPVLLAYAAYFGNWLTGNGSQGELIGSDLVTDIEDYTFIKNDGAVYTGKEFETLYWWVLPVDESVCDQSCVNLNLHAVNQTYLGLGKEATRINQLAIFPIDSQLDAGVFPMAKSEFSYKGVKANSKTHSGKNRDLAANYIYLVDPLGNIFLRYPLVKNKDEAPIMSKKIRMDILHLFKYSRLG